jgi:hypothetical protein
MQLRDHRDLDISGATPAARDAFERALEVHLSWRSGAERHLQQALQAARLGARPLGRPSTPCADTCVRNDGQCRGGNALDAAASPLLVG